MLFAIQKYQNILMGLVQSLENNVSNGFESLWSKAPELPELTLKYGRHNKAFVNFVALVGLIAVAKTVSTVTKKAINSVPLSVPTIHQIQQKYGKNSYAMVVLSETGSYQYCELLASKGLNLILVGADQDVKMTQDRLLLSTELAYEGNIELFVVDWEKEASEMKVYDEICKEYENHDISFLVLPNFALPKVHITEPTLSQNIPPFECVYMMVRKIGIKLRHREYKSAIIVVSHQQVDKVVGNEGVTNAIDSGVDAFGRCIEFEMRGQLEVVVSRGNAERALANLGINKLSQ